MLTPTTILARAASWNLTSLAAIFYSPEFVESLGFDDADDVVFAHLQQLDTIHLESLAGILAEQHFVADLDVHRANLAVVTDLAIADSDDFALVRLLGRSVGDDDAGSGLALFLHALDDDAIMQRTNFHAYFS
jgi:hypothetical protein